MRAPDFPNRAWLPDQLKGWAVIWMILVHTIELFLDSGQSGLPLAQFAMFMGGVPAAPVFMLLMGYFGLQPGYSFRKTVMRGGQILLWGVLLNLGLNFSLIIRWLIGDTEVNILHYIFGIDILIFAGFAILLSALADLLKLKWYSWLLLAICITLLSLSVNQSLAAPGDNASHPAAGYFTAILFGSVPWSYFPLIPWLAYVFTGIGLYRLFAKWPQLLAKCRYHFYLAAPAILIFLIGLIPAWRITQDLEEYYHHGPAFFIWAMAFIALLSMAVYASRRWNQNPVSLWIRFLGVRVTSAYVIQWLIIGNLGTWLYKSGSIQLTALLFIAILAATVTLSFLYYKIRRA
jgi:uncharacterized membrane protein